MYLETKRQAFPRFYFLSNDDLLEILGQAKDPMSIQPHLKKCFEGIDKVKFLDDLKIDRFISPEGEEVMTSDIIDPVGKNVEHWMLELEGMMRKSINRVMGDAIADYGLWVLLAGVAMRTTVAEVWQRVRTIARHK